jgi:hypothetical protein
MNMTCRPWPGNLTAKAAFKLAAIRKSWNQLRAVEAQLRLTFIAEEMARLAAEGRLVHGWQKRVADQLGLHPATVCRAVKKLRRAAAGRDAA